MSQKPITVQNPPPPHGFFSTSPVNMCMFLEEDKNEFFRGRKEILATGGTTLGV